MTEVYISSDNIISSLGFTTLENASEMLAGNTGIRLTTDEKISPEPFYASLVDSGKLSEKFSSIDDPSGFTRFEQLAICSVNYALKNSNTDCKDPRTLFILSATKGNIDLLEPLLGKRFPEERIFLWNTAHLIAGYFGFVSRPVVVSNACISGVQAILTGARLIRAGLFDDVVINGTDIITEFVLSGFNSFKSLSTGPCRPFDRSRDGLSLGEASGTIILTNRPPQSRSKNTIILADGYSGNDANHISGPSRTGEGLFLVIDRILKKSDSRIDFISAHGTATPYNDEMEAVAINRAGLQNVPVNSFKGYWGHTLGAAGIIESVMSIYSMRENILFKTEGFRESALKYPVRVIENITYSEVNCSLKLASGFGGSNAAVLFTKK